MFLMELSTLVRRAACLLAFEVTIPILFVSNKAVLSIQILDAIMVEVIDYR
jgi:hypothetical protein